MDMSVSEPLCRTALHQAGILKIEVYTHACTGLRL